MNLWYTEQEADHLRVGFATTKVLYTGQSEFQKLDVIETKAYGRMLLLDGLVMITDKDEFVYHEMISHIPVCLHPNPKSILVIGGGDGGTVRELLKHNVVESVTLCEIDGLVVEKSREFFPKVAGALDDPRVRVEIGDGVAYVAAHPNQFDLILVDSTDPIGPGEGLFSRSFYRDVAQALKPGGFMTAQSECPWFEKEPLARIHRNISGGFDKRQTYVGSIPTYPRGFWSWTIGAQKEIRPADFDRQRFQRVAPSLQYLTEDLFTAAFALPRFFAEKIALA